MKTKRPVIALLTDFGLEDHYVGTMKGVILSMAPHVSIVDISHAVAPQNITQGAFLLWSSYRFFPKGTILVCVVDPGVGGKRPVLCVETKQHIFLAPDNGLLQFVLGEVKVRRSVAVTNKRLFLPEVSSSFHGRDIFAPVAARLATGTSIEQLGPRTAPLTVPMTFRTIDFRREEKVRGRVVHIDRFGNIVTDLRAAAPHDERPRRNIQLILQSRRKGKKSSAVVREFHATYMNAREGKPFIMIGSTGLLEIALKNGSAAGHLEVGLGSPVVARITHAGR